MQAAICNTVTNNTDTEGAIRGLDDSADYVTCKRQGLQEDVAYKVLRHSIYWYCERS